MDDFFIGYNWPQPPGLLRAVKRAALGLGVGIVGLSGVLAAGHVPLDGGLFEFGRVQTVTGTLIETPYPMLRPDNEEGPWALLVARGKHGANDAVRGLEGRRVEVQATRIARGDQTMFEMAGAVVARAQTQGLSPAVTTPGTGSSPAATTAGSSPAVTTEADVRVTLRGEIVDSKCFLGVMVPGSGTTHRDCASLCLRGGIPPALFVREADGTSSLLLLIGPEPRLRERATALAGQPVELTGTIERRGGWRTVESNPDEWRRVGR